MNTTGRGSAAASRSSAAPIVSGPVAPSARRVVVGRRLAALAAVVGRQPPPAAVEVDEDLLDGVAVDRERLGDRGPRHDRHVVLGRRAAEQDDDRDGRGHVTARPPVAEELDLRHELDAELPGDLVAGALEDRPDVGGACPSGR